jgi:4'-phosphopantetheinyl transferase EntD
MPSSDSRAPAADCLDALFPPGVATVLSLTIPAESGLLPGEEPSTGPAAPARLAEFRHGRICARAALARLGRGAVAIPVGQDREPCWPVGVVGSISHAGEAAAAAVSLASRHAALGLDLEPATGIEADLWPRICRPGEIAALPTTRTAHHAQLVFSAKESAYKALWPVLRQFLDFHDLEIRFAGDQESFAVVSHAAACPAALAGRLDGRWLEVGGLIATAVTLRLPPAL